jgi:hypothetical protein
MWNIFIGINGVLLCLIGIKINCTGHVIAVGADAKQWQYNKITCKHDFK